MPSANNSILDLFGLGLGQPQQPQLHPQIQRQPSFPDKLSIFGNMPIGTPVATRGSDFPSLSAFQNEQLTITFDFNKPNPSSPQFTLINVTYQNNTSNDILDLNMLAAPPKYAKFSISLMSSTQIPPRGVVYQQIKVVNGEHGQKPIMMKMQISYSFNGQAIVNGAVVKNFPEGL